MTAGQQNAVQLGPRLERGSRIPGRRSRSGFNALQIGPTSEP